VSALWYRSFIYVVYADNLLCTWLTDHIYVALNGFTYVTTCATVSIDICSHQAKTQLPGVHF
jgi:hypothetical protein